jgi:outer membrane protein OmpA-like peptidoglycan-associated protein
MVLRPAALRTKAGFRLLALAGALLLWAGFVGAPAAAKTPSEVTVDTGVLNSLGNSGSGSAHRIHLHPPRRDRQAKSATHKTARTTSRHSHRQAARRRGHAKRTAHAKSHRNSERTASNGREAGRKRTGRRRHETKLRRDEIESKTDLQVPPKSAASAPKPPDLRKEVLAPAPALPPATAAMPEPSPPTAAAMPEPPPAKPETPPAEHRAVAAAGPPPAPPARLAPPVAQPTAIEKSRGPSGAAAHVDFAAGSADLSSEARGALDAIAKSLAADTERRLQLVAYATGTNDEANQARRLSLSRALNVRAYLIDHGVRNTRMDVRALGNRPDDGKPADRVDILYVGQ